MDARRIGVTADLMRQRHVRHMPLEGIGTADAVSLVVGGVEVEAMVGVAVGMVVAYRQAIGAARALISGHGYVDLLIFGKSQRQAEV